MNELKFSLVAGDFIKCDYNGKHRPCCEVDEIIDGADYLRVLTGDGYRNFKYAKMENVVLIRERLNPV